MNTMPYTGKYSRTQWCSQVTVHDHSILMLFVYENNILKGHYAGAHCTQIYIFIKHCTHAIIHEMFCTSF